ncbi:MAG: hypothetical protein UX91_C0001G0113 [Candidatus Amesbacteria bacterium GW2011_GWB1_47_19]|nr:MAG: hypothetical protein UX91_C0001G0113 [Candidatus Amesbacteria bacterium GW2011_GWB1_47_19]
MPDVYTSTKTQQLVRLQKLIYSLSLIPPEIPPGETPASVEIKIWSVVEQILPFERLKLIKKDEEPLLALNLALLELSQEKIDSMYGILKTLVDDYENHLRLREQEAEKIRHKNPTVHDKMLSQLEMISRSVAQRSPQGKVAAEFFNDVVEPTIYRRVATNPESVPLPDLARTLEFVLPSQSITNLIAPLADTLTFIYPNLKELRQSIRSSVVSPIHLTDSASDNLANVLFVEKLIHPQATPDQFYSRLTTLIPQINLPSDDTQAATAAVSSLSQNLASVNCSRRHPSPGCRRCSRRCRRRSQV